MSRCVRARTGAIVALFLALLVASLAIPAVRRCALVVYLHLGDLLARAPPERLVAGEQLLLDASSADDRAGLARTHGDLRAERGGDGRSLLLRGGEVPGEHELCTRRVPRDWAPWSVLRLELSAPTGGRSPVDGRPLPLLLTLRLRNRPGWTTTRWYRLRTFLGSGDRQLEVDLRPASRFISPQQVRQLCLSLEAAPRAGRPSLILSRVVLSRRWSVERVSARSQDDQDTAQGLSLHLLGDSTKLRRGDPPPRASARTVNIVAARGETVAFQVALRWGGAAGGLEAARLTLPPLVGPDGQELHAELFEERTLVVRQGSSALFGPNLGGPGVYPDPLVPLPPSGRIALEDGNRLVWVDVPVPESAPPGRYSSTLRVQLGGQERTVGVGVEVRPARLPDAPPLTMILYLPQQIRQAARVSGPAYEELERAYHRLVRAHEAYLATTPALVNMERFVPMLDGSLFTAGPHARARQPLPYWPVDLMASDRDGLQRSARRTMQWFAAHKLRTQPFSYLFDEPGRREDYDEVRRRAGWLHSAPSPGQLLPVMVTEQVEPDDPSWPSLVGSVDYWISPQNFPEPAATRRRTTPERFFTYNGGEPGSGSQLLDADGVSLRTWGWIAFRFDIELWLLWEGAYYQDIYNGGPPHDPYVDAATFDKRPAGKGEDFGNGDGLIVYPPLERGGLPVASLRLKVLRRGGQDRRYLLAVARCGHEREARALARQLVPRAFNEARDATTSWPRDEAPWEQARLALLRLLEQCQR